MPSITSSAPPQPVWTPTPSTHGGAADPWATFQPASAAAAPDPWAAGRVGGGNAACGAGPAQHFHMGTPVDGKGGGKGTGGGYPLRIDARAWGNDGRKLDIGTGFDAFQTWKARALMFLSRDRPDVRKLLTWAESQTKEGVASGIATAASNLGVGDLDAVEFALCDGIQCIIQDSLLSRARSANGGGCELWRSLVAEWSGAAPQLKQAKARRYLEPARSKDMADLWSKLPAWERLGEEVATAGLGMPE